MYNKILGLLDSLSNVSSDEELTYFITNVKEKYPYDAGIASSLAQILANSGDVLSFNQGFTADVASTGGPTSLSTLLCPLFLRAVDSIVPKLAVSGRPAGGIDCLGQIKGYKVYLNKMEAISVLESCKYAHFLASTDFSPLDGRMFKLRKRFSALNVPTLVVASLLAKKISVGVRYIGLDVRVAPHGNFGNDWATAFNNSRLFINTANKLSINAVPVLTDARFPYQPYIGRAESLVALDDIFQSTPNNWLTEHLNICRSLSLACIPAQMRTYLKDITGEDLFRFFKQNILAQGGTVDNFNTIVRLTRNQHFREIRAMNDGFVYYPIGKLRDVFVRWQNKYIDAVNEFPDPIGLILKQRPGTWIEQGEIIATLRSPENIADQVIRDLSDIIGKTVSIPVCSIVEGVINNG
jgi:thymidine phosphorylase